MSPGALMAIFMAAHLLLLSTDALQRPKTMISNNITVMGSVYCDPCSNSSSKHSFFLTGARVLIQCRLKVDSASMEQLFLEAERVTDRLGIYKLDIPPVDGFECREGREIKSACRATLVGSSSSSCNVPGLKGSTQHVAVKSMHSNACLINLNALDYRPARGCGTKKGVTSSLDASFFFWPFLPPWWPPGLPPFSCPPSLPFPFPRIPVPEIPQWLLPFLRPPFFPFPFSPLPGSAPPAKSSPPAYLNLPPSSPGLASQP